MTIEDYQKKINTIFEAERCMNIELNEWESQFLESIDIQLNDRKDLSWKQSKTLNNIWGRVV